MLITASNFTFRREQVTNFALLFVTSQIAFYYSSIFIHHVRQMALTSVLQQTAVSRYQS
jgi:hypothetical protein